MAFQLYLNKNPNACNYYYSLDRNDKLICKKYIQQEQLVNVMLHTFLELTRISNKE